MVRLPRRRALTMLEVLIALVVLMLAAVTLIRSGGSIHQRSYLNEFHAIAAIRARTVLSFASALDFDVLCRMVGTAPTASFAPLSLGELFEPGELEAVFAAPSVRNSMYAEKLKDFSHVVRGRVVEPDLLELEIVVSWKMPAEKRETPHEFRLLSSIHRPNATFSLRR